MPGRSRSDRECGALGLPLARIASFQPRSLALSAEQAVHLLEIADVQGAHRITPVAVRLPGDASKPGLRGFPRYQFDLHRNLRRHRFAPDDVQSILNRQPAHLLRMLRH